MSPTCDNLDPTGEELVDYLEEGRPGRPGDGGEGNPSHIMPTCILHYISYMHANMHTYLYSFHMPSFHQFDG